MRSARAYNQFFRNGLSVLDFEGSCRRGDGFGSGTASEIIRVRDSEGAKIFSIVTDMGRTVSHPFVVDFMIFSAAGFHAGVHGSGPLVPL